MGRAGSARGVVRGAAKHVLRRKKRALVVAGALLFGGYGVTYAMGEAGRSPTDQRMALPDGRTLAYSVHRTGREGAVTTRVILLDGAPTNASSWGRVIESAGKDSGA